MTQYWRNIQANGRRRNKMNMNPISWSCYAMNHSGPNQTEKNKGQNKRQWHKKEDCFSSNEVGGAQKLDCGIGTLILWIRWASLWTHSWIYVKKYKDFILTVTKRGISSVATHLLWGWTTIMIEMERL